MKDMIDYSEFVALCQKQEKIELTEEEKAKIVESRKIFEAIIKSHPKTAYYGINTGIGALFGERIPENKLGKFQENLVMSHACGVGESLNEELVRGMMLHMILNLKKGHSGIRLKTLELLVEMFNKNLVPVVPCKGSLGASGDLIPQAHIALCLIGKGKIWHQGLILPAEQILRVFGLGPVKLEAGEAIALLNGTSFMTSLLAFLVARSDNLIKAAQISAAMTLRALGANSKSFDSALQRLRPHLGQIVIGYEIENLLKPENCRRSSKFLQSAYSLRCIPQVHGAFLESLIRAREVIDIEINSFCGNPILITEEQEPILTQGSGNFHGQLLSQIADSLSIALCGLSNISERRIDKLLNRGQGNLPLFLAKKQGFNTGLMIVQYTAAALASESKTLAHPASVDSIPVSAGQEDFVSMGAWAARKAWEICKNTEYVIAIEILCAAQALDLKKSLSRESKIGKIHKIIRNRIPPINRDREFWEDIERICDFIRSGEFLKEIEREKDC